MNSKLTLQDFQKKHEISVLGKSGLLQKFSVRGGSNLWAALRKAGIPIGSACSGVGVCAACCVTVEPRSALTDQNEFELNSIIRNQKSVTSDSGHHLRLACLCRVIGSLTVRADYW